MLKTTINGFVPAAGEPLQHFQVSPYGLGELEGYAILNIISTFSGLRTYLAFR